MSARPVKKTHEETNEKIQRFFSVAPVPRKPTDYHPAYQIEILEVQGSKINKRYFYDKPDTKQIVMAKLELINDPDSQEGAEFDV